MTVGVLVGHSDGVVRLVVGRTDGLRTPVDGDDEGTLVDGLEVGGVDG